MALKDWKKIRDEKVYGDEPEKIFFKKNKSVYLWDLYFNKRIAPSKRYAITVQKYDPSKSYGLGTRLIVKYFRTKTQALKFAKDYMKKH